MAVVPAALHRDLAGAQPLAARAFADAFQTVQRGKDRYTLEGLAAAPLPEPELQALAFAHAEQAGFLVDLVAEIFRRRPTPGFQAATRRAGLRGEGADLQSILDAFDRQQDPDVFAQGLQRSASQTCAVVIDGDKVGTGFLIAPTIVATAFHVVEPLVETTAEGPAPAAGAHSRLEFLFDDQIVLFAGVRRKHQPNRCVANPDWLVHVSGYHPVEKLNRVPATPDELKDRNDLALCRLATIVGIGLDGLALDQTGQLGVERQPIGILQHPRGGPLKYHRKFAQKTPSRPIYRVEHDVNTAGGSSGAPCLDDEFRVCGMHQAGRENGPANGAGRGGSGNSNRCVPISWSVPAILAARVDDPGLMPVSQLDDGSPVIGRSTVSDWVFRTLRGAQIPAVLAVTGDAVPGKSFTARLMRALLPGADHRILTLSLADFEGMDTYDAIARLWLEAGFPPGEMPGRDRLTTSAAHMRYGVVRAFLDRVAATGPDAPKSTWIVVDDYDDEVLDGQPGGTWDLFNHLLTQAGAANRLRFALLGYRSARATVQARVRMLHEELAPPTAQELDLFLRLKGAPNAPAEVQKMFLGIFAGLIARIPFDYGFYDKLVECLGGTET